MGFFESPTSIIFRKSSTSICLLAPHGHCHFNKVVNVTAHGFFISLSNHAEDDHPSGLVLTSSEVDSKGFVEVALQIYAFVHETFIPGCC